MKKFNIILLICTLFFIVACDNEPKNDLTCEDNESKVIVRIRYKKDEIISVVEDDEELTKSKIQDLIDDYDGDIDAIINDFIDDAESNGATCTETPLV